MLDVFFVVTDKVREVVRNESVSPKETIRMRERVAKQL